MNQPLHATVQSSLKECAAHVGRLHRGETLLAPHVPLTTGHLRNLGNNLANDYPESTEQTVATLNQIYVDWHALEEILTRARTGYQRVADTTPETR